MIFYIFYEIIPLEIRKIMDDKLIEYKKLMKLTTEIKKKMIRIEIFHFKIRICK